ncbi:MAG TPA: 30S ribosomal protein S16 [Candidatus Paceibacterota bacterium]|nr:30S ribosomal protein S16 [Candidatus Paceibacterota bacterium]
MLMIRFQRIGRTNDATFRIVAVEKARAAKSGSVLAQLGSYNPRSKALTLDAEAVKGWIGKGAQLSPSVNNLLIAQKVIEGAKVSAVRRKNIVKPVEAEVAETPAEAPAEPALAEETPAASAEAPAS